MSRVRRTVFARNGKRNGPGMTGFIARHQKLLILLLLFTILFWLITIQVKNGRFPFLERPVLAVSGFFERIITWPFNTVVSLGKGYVFLVGTERENRRLKEELDRLTIENSATNELLLENERLREALDFKKLSRRPRSRSRSSARSCPPPQAPSRSTRAPTTASGRTWRSLLPREWSGRYRPSSPVRQRSFSSPTPGARWPSGSSGTGKKACSRANWSTARLKYVSYLCRHPGRRPSGHLGPRRHLPQGPCGGNGHESIET